MPTALEAMQHKEASFKEALMTSVRPAGATVAFDKKIEPKDIAKPVLSDVGIKPATSVNRGAPTAPIAKAVGAK